MRISEWTKPIKLTEQQEKCQELAKIYGYEIVSEIQEITNECRSRRMGILQIKDLVDLGKIDTVIAVNADKFFHKQEDLMSFIKYCDDRNAIVLTQEEGCLNLLVHLPKQQEIKRSGKVPIMKM